METMDYAIRLAVPFNRTIKELKLNDDEFVTKGQSTFNRTIKELK